jgi:hypothetical protein
MASSATPSSPAFPSRTLVLSDLDARICASEIALANSRKLLEETAGLVRQPSPKQ